MNRDRSFGKSNMLKMLLLAVGLGGALFYLSLSLLGVIAASDFFRFLGRLGVTPLVAADIEIFSSFAPSSLIAGFTAGYFSAGRWLTAALLAIIAATQLVLWIGLSYWQPSQLYGSDPLDTAMQLFQSTVWILFVFLPVGAWGGAALRCPRNKP